LTTTPLLEARDLKKQFSHKLSPFQPPKTVSAVDGINLSLNPGEILGLAGESGSGKSTVAKILMGLMPPTSGQVLFNGRTISSLNHQQLNLFRKTVQMVFQDPFSSLNPRMRIGETIAEPLLIHRVLPGEKIRGRVQELLQRVGLSPDHYDRYPHEFSGGQRQRIGIARALAVGPEAIIADEPLSALDVSVQAQIINLLLELQTDFRLAYLLISHDLAVIRHLSNRVAIMYLGRIVEEGSRDDIFTRCLHPYTEALLAAIPGFSHLGGKTAPGFVIETTVSPANITGCNFNPRCPYRRDICITDVPPLEAKEDGHKAACHFSKDIYRQQAAAPASRAKDLDKASGRDNNFLS